MPKPHLHRFKVASNSTFGLKNVHAILDCVGVVDKKPCPKTEVRMLRYDDLEKETTRSGKTTYYLQEKEPA